ncbi:Uncharacterized protein TPAR_07693 [Tolypocladium paradoxum]|uniref:AB hydrolase-1 domain-containing protein n=1 Tax=Tolypocladium paradoxum TaxID=94208 RepID=A0A2S4KPH1_9HYPO|nr:Uncharacterized protein TPAR_07693 [Tolypocladium paradoxum]
MTNENGRNNPHRRATVRQRLFLAGFAALELFCPATMAAHIPRAESWSWDSTEPSTSLNWQKCYNGKLNIALIRPLQVPMDWQHPSDDKHVALAVVKLPAASEENNLPPLFINPGGPGVSGVDFMKSSAKSLQVLVGDNQSPANSACPVGLSTPRIECWGDSHRREIWTINQPPVVDQHADAVFDTYARSVAFSNACEQALNRTSILEYASTAYHARDMLQILKKTGYSKLRYWGISWGTILGAAFAGLFPDRVERFLSDGETHTAAHGGTGEREADESVGNIDYQDWFSGNLANFLVDADRVFDAFDNSCFKVGPEKCVLWADCPQAIQERRAMLLQNLKKSPILIPAWSRPTGPEVPVLVSYSKVQRFTQQAIYDPYMLFPVLAQLYESLERGNGLLYYDLTADGSRANKLCPVSVTPAGMPVETPFEPDALPGITCSDSMPLRDTPDQFAEYAQRLATQSKWIGSANVDLRAACLGRSVRAKWRFTEKDIKCDTASPILFVGNTGDNVTPLQAARNNSAYFPSSVVLVQNSYGLFSWLTWWPAAWLAVGAVNLHRNAYTSILSERLAARPRNRVRARLRLVRTASSPGPTTRQQRLVICNTEAFTIGIVHSTTQASAIS